MTEQHQGIRNGRLKGEQDRTEAGKKKKNTKGDQVRAAAGNKKLKTKRRTRQDRSRE